MENEDENINIKKYKLVLAVVLVAAVIYTLLQPVTVAVPLGDEHSDYVLINGVQLQSCTYNHTENPPLTEASVILSNPRPLVAPFSVQYEHETVKESVNVNNSFFNMTYYNAKAVGFFTVRTFTKILHPDLREHLGIGIRPNIPSSASFEGGRT